MSTFKISVGITVITFIAAIVTLAGLPSGTELPIHWNINGDVDRTADALYSLLLPPILMLFVMALLLVLKYIEPRKENLKQSKEGINAIILSLMVLFFVMEAGYIALVSGIEFSMNKVVIFGVGLSFLIMGNYFGKIRSNFFVGIKTPWTLSSDAVWQKTHRLAGKLTMLAGLITSIAIWFLQPDQGTYLVAGLLIPSMLIPTAYSWWLWRQEQQKDSVS